MNRKQRFKLANDCHSEWSSIPVGVPQGTKLGPWLFVITINDLSVQGVSMWKYVDDTTILEVLEYGQPSNIQAAVDSLSKQSLSNEFQLDESKCKEIGVCFAKKQPTNNPVEVNGTPLEVVYGAKIQGVNISNDLKWNGHISELVKKTSSRLYCLRQLKRSRVSLKELILFYCTCIRSLLEYACPVSTVLTWTTIWNVYKDALLGLFTLPCLMLKPLARQDYLHYLKEEKKSPRNSSSRSVQIRNTNYIHFCQK